LDKELATIQGKLAHITRPIDTFVHETIVCHDPTTDDNERAFALVNCIRVMLADLAAQISQTRSTAVYQSVDLIPPLATKQAPLISLERLTEQRKHTEAVVSATKKYKPPARTVDAKNYKGK
jgi:hypothetical protein